MPSNTSHGGPYFRTAKSGAVKNNGATVLLGGNATTSGLNPNVSQVLGATTLGYHSGSNGSLMPGPFTPLRYIPNRCVTKAVSTGAYARMAAGQYIMILYCSQIAGLARTTLNCPGADFGRLPYPARVSNFIRTQVFVMGGGWYWQTGIPVNRFETTDTLASEAFPTRAIPGHITFAVSAQVRTTSNYSAKNT